MVDRTDMLQRRSGALLAVIPVSAMVAVHTVTENNYSTLNLKLAAAEHCQFIGALILSWRGRHTDGGSFTLYVKFFGWMKSEWLLIAKILQASGSF